MADEIESNRRQGERRFNYIDVCVKLAQIEEKIISLDLRINGSIDDMKDHIAEGRTWRMMIVGIMVSFVIQTITLAVMWGKITRTVEINTGRIDYIESLHPRKQ